jgi:N-dimethylarginine dimethylaminohydrolase
MLLITCSPDQFDVKYSINPWMSVTLASDTSVNKKLVKKQYNQFIKLLQTYAYVNIVPVKSLDPLAKLPDIIYTANAALFLPNLPRMTTIISRMLKAQRQPEEQAWKSYMNSIGINIITLPLEKGLYFEGEGDVCFTPDLTKMFCGYGIRSTKKGINALKVIIDKEYKRQGSIDKKPELYEIKLINPKYYHIDLCFKPLNNNCALIRRNAIAPKSIKLIESMYETSKLIDLDDTESYSCNGLAINNHYLCSNGISAKTIRKIEELAKMKVSTVPMTEFEKGGGSLKCMILTVL